MDTWGENRGVRSPCERPTSLAGHLYSKETPAAALGRRGKCPACFRSSSVHGSRTRGSRDNGFRQGLRRVVLDTHPESSAAWGQAWQAGGDLSCGRCLTKRRKKKRVGSKSRDQCARDDPFFLGPAPPPTRISLVAAARRTRQGLSR